jgi:hypothetical protein
MEISMRFLAKRASSLTQQLKTVSYNIRFMQSITYSAEEVLGFYAQLSPTLRLQMLRRLESTVCPECGSMNFANAEGEKSCRDCGLVIDKNQRVTVASFAQEKQGNPSNSASFGKSNGDTLRENDIFKVLAAGYVPDSYSFDAETKTGTINYAPGTKKFTEDLGLRARFIRIYVSTVEHPVVKQLLEISLRLLKEWNIDPKSTFGVSFGNYFATQIRLLGAYFAVLRIKPSLKQMADATFALCLKECGKYDLMNEVLDKQKVDRNLLEGLNLFFTVTEEFKRRSVKT